MSNVMLKELYIDNFKSFRKSKFKFGKVNCLIAPNNAGKSNLVEVLEIVNMIINKSTSSIFSKCINADNYRYDDKLISIIALLDVHSIILLGDYLISYQFETTINTEIDIGNNNGMSTYIFNTGKIKGIKIKREDIIKKSQFSIVHNNDILEYLSDYPEYITKLNSKRFSSIDGNIKTANDLYSLILNSYDTKLNIARAGEMFIPALNVFDTTDIFSSFYFHPETIKKQQNYETNFLLKDGTNLAYFLNTIDKEVLENISMSLIGEVELIESIEITDGSVPTIVFNENVNGNTQKIIQQKVSDGTIHFLSLMTALQGSQSSCLVFEEPERHMHMKTLSYILNTMRDSNKQIFFTTHSTEILQQLELDEIIFMFRDFDGDTKGQRAKDIPYIKNFMKRYKNDLLEMIKCGLIGEYEDKTTDYGEL